MYMTNLAAETAPRSETAADILPLLYAGTPLDTQTAYVRDFLRFLGIEDVEFVYAEGLAMGDAPKNAALAKARESILRLAQPEAVAA